ncbi:MAG: RES family NAD+ phosphorylase [Actinomycetota bacterium]
MIVFRHADPRRPFVWESAAQPSGRWHEAGRGPAHYLADTPAGAWAEFLRHEEITDPADLEGVRRAVWAIDIPELPEARPTLADRTLRGGTGTYPRCRREAERLRAGGAGGLVAPSAALEANGARGHVVDGGVKPGPAHAPRVIVLFGRRPDLVGRPVVEDGRPPRELLAHVRHL